VRLAETQALFHALVTGDAPAGAAERIAVSTPGLDAEERVGIYAGMYRARLVEALAADFPKLKRLLGDERFWALGVAYAAEHPSEDADLGRFGRNLAAFLRRHPSPDRPDVADLAALEWARSEVFFEASAEPLRREDLALAPEAFAPARLRFVPALRLVEGTHAAAPLWRALEVGELPPAPAPGPEAIAVWRNGFEVFHASLVPEEADALARALGGAALAHVCGAFAGLAEPAAAAFAALSSWVDDGWVAGVDAPRARAA
jgi:hypothetical protein